MAVNKVVYGTRVLIDLSSDTVAANQMLSGITAHTSAGDVVTGNVIIQTYYTGSGAPTSDMGSNGDIYIDLG